LISKIHKRLGIPREIIEKSAAARRGKPPWNKGRNMPDGFGEKMSKALKGRKVDPDALARRVAAQSGKPRSEKWKASIRESWIRRKQRTLNGMPIEYVAWNKGKNMPDGFAEKMSIATKRVWDGKRQSTSE
jgi:hypothetical protein